MRLHFHIWKNGKEMRLTPEGLWAHYRRCVICGKRQYHWSFWNSDGWKDEVLK